MARKLSKWNLFVKKVFAEGKGKNASYKFKDALREASSRKSEMGGGGVHTDEGMTTSTSTSTRKHKKGGKRSTKKMRKGGNKSRKSRK